MKHDNLKLFACLLIITLLFGIIIGYTIKYNELVDKYSFCMADKSEPAIKIKEDVYYQLREDGQIETNQSYTIEDIRNGRY